MEVPEFMMGRGMSLAVIEGESVELLIVVILDVLTYNAN